MASNSYLEAPINSLGRNRNEILKQKTFVKENSGYKYDY